MRADATVTSQDNCIAGERVSVHMVKEVCHLLVDCGTVCSIERKTELDRSLNNRWVEESGTGSFGLA